MKQRGRKVAIAVGLLTVFVLLGGGLFFRQAIWLEWCRREAARDCLREGFDPEKPTTAFRALLRVGEVSYPQMAKLIRDERYEVWMGTSDLLDAFVGSPDPILEYFLREDHMALLRYLFNVDQNERTLWRADTWTPWSAVDRGYTDATWYEYWSRRKGEILEPFSEGINFCERVLLGKTQCPADLDLKIRALHALAAMLQPGEVVRPRSPIAGRILRILTKAAREDPDPEVRFDAVFRLILRSEEGRSTELAKGFRIIKLQEWLEFPRLEKKPEGCNHPWNLLAICHLDHPLALRIMGRLLKDKVVAPRLQGVLNRRSPLGPLPMPEWIPEEKAARRFLAGSALECFHAAVLIAEENLREEAPAVQEAIQVQGRKEVRAALNACLLALGDEKRREAVRTEVEALHAGGVSSSPWPRFRSQDLAEVLLLSGDLELLSKESLEQMDFPIEDFIDGLPEELKANPIPGSWTDEEAAWWVKNKARISWDAAKRRFVVR